MTCLDTANGSTRPRAAGLSGVPRIARTAGIPRHPVPSVVEYAFKTMACFHPLKGYRGRINANGKSPIVFNPKHGYIDRPVLVPCGQCIGCRLEKSRQWAIRCLHEASLYERNSFVTLTYNDAHLPEDGSLSLRHLQLFMKRLRRKHGVGIRFYACGEYGDQLGRPHYHICLFNFEPPDKKPFKESNGQTLYTSEDLDSLWGQGYTLTGDVTFKSAAYVARYIMKKVTGPGANKHYETVDPVTGEIHQRKPEFTTQSKRPGLGKEWLNKFKTDVYPDDFIVVNNKKMRPPRFYDKQFEITNADHFLLLKRRRTRAAIKHADNNTPSRLKVRETIQKRKADQLLRKL